MRRGFTFINRKFTDNSNNDIDRSDRLKRAEEAKETHNQNAIYKDLDKLNRRQTFHALFDDQIIGISQKDRNDKICNHCFWIFILLMICMDCVYIIYWLTHLRGKMGE